MTYSEIQDNLKSNTFKSTNDRGQNFLFKFTEINVFRDGKHIADYELTANDSYYFITFSNIEKGISINDFKNILLVVNDKFEILNYDKTDLQKRGRIETTFVAQEK